MARQTHPLVRALFLHHQKLIVGVALVIVGIMLIREIAWAPALIIAGALLFGYGVIRILRVVQDDRPEIAHPIPSDLPLDDRIRILRRGLWLIPLLLVPLSAWASWDLYRLETGQVAEIQIWSVIGDIYNYYGFWPAVLFAPVGTLLFEGFLLFGLRQLRRQAH